MIDSKNKFVGNNDLAKNGDVIIFEVDMRSKEREKRTMKMFINGKQQKYYFYNLPETVRFCVCCIILWKRNEKLIIFEYIWKKRRLIFEYIYIYMYIY